MASALDPVQYRFSTERRQSVTFSTSYPTRGVRRRGISWPVRLDVFRQPHTKKRLPRLRRPRLLYRAVQANFQALLPRVSTHPNPRRQRMRRHGKGELQDAVVQWSLQLLPDVNADGPANLVPPATPPHGCLMIVTRNRQHRGILFDCLPPTSQAGHRPKVLADAGTRWRLVH